ncbi:indolepyruvate ferredoxin oxidoreductase subunit alpha [bacterium]|nr:indolepyruvate ferredoxin oxidoreductase subunit alpha [bacterium]
MSPDKPETFPGGGGYRLLLGNEAIAQGLYEAGCRVAAAYPGTPSTEVLQSLVSYGADDLHLEWSVNEKVALEVSAAASYTGLRSVAVMKQVGLNVALDPLMSLAYTGVVGGMIVVVADDPGPHSSQTEQDTRLLAMTAGIPLLDPSTPEEAREMVHVGYQISEKYRIPVILRPVLRICHARAPIPPPTPREAGPEPKFVKDVNRWAATPRHRFTLHRELNEKTLRMLADPEMDKLYTFMCGEKGDGSFAVLASSVVAAYAADVLGEMGLADEIPLLAARFQWPLNVELIQNLLGKGRRVLILEETGQFMEILLRDRFKVSGRWDGLVPSQGELTPDIVTEALERMLVSTGAKITLEVPPCEPGSPVLEKDKGQPSPPTLCAGCPHRSSFWALKKVMPDGIYTGDIGCYTLGIELNAVDTVLCMGASVSQAAGFYWAYRQASETPPPIAAVIGDSTFYHAGIPALLNAVQQGAAFVLMILDNDTTAMTGCQPTPGSGVLADGGVGRKIPLEDVVKGCGVRDLRITDPCDSQDILEAVEEAAALASEGEMAVVISRSPCVLNMKERQGPVPTIDMELCNECGICTDSFGCPAIRSGDEGFMIVNGLCPGCGICVHVCPSGAIKAGKDG